MIDFSRIRTYPIRERKNRVSVKRFRTEDSPVRDRGIHQLAECILRAHNQGKEVVLMMGGHPIKVGVAGHIIDLIKNKVITHVAMNGSASIHDFEIAMIGQTSEDVSHNIRDGSFGMSEETGHGMNSAIKEGISKGMGYGYSVAARIRDFRYRKHSILYNALEAGIPATVHVAIGTDIIHQHPSCDGGALGEASYRDFKILADTLSRLEDGVAVNLGSAVIMPEVFIKALSVARNICGGTSRITTANLDMLDHYRPRVNVVERPTDPDGTGIFIQGRHEKTIPGLHALIMKGLKNGH
ncbi:MAG: hypothetical protein ABH879_10090 [archaeon]